MKRPLALLLACILLLTTFAGCGKKKPGAKADDTAEYEALYAPVLKKYKQAFEEEWPREKFLETGLAPNLAGLEKTAEPSFAFLDLNNDKTPELFIGRADEAATVYDLYTADGENIKHLIDAAGETTLTLTDDARLAEKSDAYESLEVTTFYKMDDDSLTPTDSYIHDPDKIIDGMDEWYHKTGELPKSESEFYAEDMEVISKDDYDRGATGYTEAKLAMKEFAELDAKQLPDSDAEIIEDLPEPKVLYAPILNSYQAAIVQANENLKNNGDDEDDSFRYLEAGRFVFIDRGLNNFLGWDWTGAGYAFIDLDNNGIDELLIGRVNTETDYIYELFTFRNGEFIRVTGTEYPEDWELCSEDVYYCGNDCIMISEAVHSPRSDSVEWAHSEYKNIYQFKDGQLQFKEAYILDDHTHPQAPYFYTTNQDYRTTFNGLQPLGGQAEYESRCPKPIKFDQLDYVLFSDTETIVAQPRNSQPVKISTPYAGTREYITFGSYEQDNNTANGAEPIEWLILEKEGNQALVISRNILDLQCYNEGSENATWETCSLRKWLNGTFLNAAFNAEEQSRIHEARIPADKNPLFSASSGNDTKDKIFLLSTKEATQYFAFNEMRKAAITEFAYAKGTGKSEFYRTEGNATGWWLLRTTGGQTSEAAEVSYGGFIFYRGYGITEKYGGGVRPAMWITLDA